ncbi:unnamed protein product [Pleuronectes platessa]|uniref:Peptidase M12B propeptide domain-containing protein n=1 Tax=Pleuronectes platessa TaxID=8262 RepID=A0A9N7Y8S8_PLEPL|nr:unnamed protein product [Pleuronectes platessa]
MGLSPGFTVLILLPAFLLHTSGLYIASSVDSLQHVLGEYGLVRPISVDAEGRFLSHAVSADHMAGGQSRRRQRREVGAGNDEWEGPRGVEEDREPVGRRERLYYNVTVFGREFHLRLRHNARLVAPGAKIEWRDGSDSTRHSEPLQDECLYVGDIPDTPGATVAISNCDGLVSDQAVLPVLLISPARVHCVRWAGVCWRRIGGECLSLWGNAGLGTRATKARDSLFDPSAQRSSALGAAVRNT